MQPIFLTSQRLITEHWPAVAALLAPVEGKARGDFSLTDLEELAREGRAVAGLCFDGERPVLAMVFEFRYYPRKTVLNVMALAGSELGSIASTFWPSFLSWAEESGATEVEACCAPAMTRMLQPLGFQHVYNFVRMPVGAAT